ncbi:MAG: RNA methyltransferase [bacterium]
MTREPSAPEQTPSPSVAPKIAPQDKRPFFGLLDSVRSVWNVGSMFRTADATGLSGLFLCGVTATPPRPDMEKTALGATLTVPWDYWENAVEAVTHLQQNGVRVIALERTNRAKPYDDFDYAFPLCCVVGHEVRGVSPAVLAQVDATVEIPMCGTKDSLNVAVSFGILTYEIRKQWLRQPESTPFAPQSLFRDIASRQNRGGST